MLGLWGVEQMKAVPKKGVFRIKPEPSVGSLSVTRKGFKIKPEPSLLSSHLKKKSSVNLKPVPKKVIPPKHVVHVKQLSWDELKSLSQETGANLERYIGQLKDALKHMSGYMTNTSTSVDPWRLEYGMSKNYIRASLNDNYEDYSSSFSSDTCDSEDE